MTFRRASAVACAALLLFALSHDAIESRRPTLPDRLDDAEFWRLHTELSEPGGTFRSDNLVSNERTFPSVLPDVARRASPGAAYIGVGPEQNFTYLAALGPRVAFIVDIRRENAALHLFYKALFELSPTRVDFLTRLFSRPLSKHLGPGSSASDLMEAATVAGPNRDLFTANLADIKTTLSTRHRWKVDDADFATMAGIYEAFFERGPDLRYSMRSRGGWPFPTYAELMTAAAEKGGPGSFLATEAAYQAVRDLHSRNLVVPVVGDFSGSRALAGVAAYLREHGLTVAVFYASNVEMYLFRSDGWKAFYRNLSLLPVDSRSAVVRSVFRGFGPSYSGGGAGTQPAWLGASGLGFPGVLWVDPIQPLLADVDRGTVTTYGDLLARMK